MVHHNLIFYKGFVLCHSFQKLPPPLFFPRAPPPRGGRKNCGRGGKSPYPPPPPPPLLLGPPWSRVRAPRSGPGASGGGPCPAAAAAPLAVKQRDSRLSLPQLLTSAGSLGWARRSGHSAEKNAALRTAKGRNQPIQRLQQQKQQKGKGFRGFLSFSPRCSPCRAARPRPSRPVNPEACDSELQCPWEAKRTGFKLWLGGVKIRLMEQPGPPCVWVCKCVSMCVCVRVGGRFSCRSVLSCCPPAAFYSVVCVAAQWGCRRDSAHSFWRSGLWKSNFYGAVVRGCRAVPCRDSWMCLWKWG